MNVLSLWSLKAVIYPLICEYEPGTVFLKDDWRENNLYNYKFYWGIEAYSETAGRK